MGKLKLIIIIVALVLLIMHLGERAGFLKSDKGEKSLQPGMVKPIKPFGGMDKIINPLQKTASQKEEKKTSAQYRPGDNISLHFKDGTIMAGELVKQTRDSYVIKWKGKETVIYAEMVEKVSGASDVLAQKKGPLSDTDISSSWPYQNDCVIRLTNQEILDARIIRPGKDYLSLEHAIDKTASIEQNLNLNQVDYLLFKPVVNEESRKIEENLKKLFPKMKFYTTGNFTIVTDSYTTWVDEYRKTINEAYTNIYLKFFKVFKDRHPSIHNFIVVFDSYPDFVEYAIADGVPGWAVAGYFSPTDRVLYLFNVLGEQMEQLLFEAMVGESGRAIDDFVDNIEQNVDKSYHVFVEGQAKRIKDKFWQAYGYYKHMYNESTLGTLRHEFTHELFNNYGLQSVTLSRAEKKDDAIVEKKKKFLETKDYKKKAEIIKGMITLRSEPLELRAANSWLAEGTATYCETAPPGNQNNLWLYFYQEAEREKALAPLEALTVYKIGSFPGVCPKAMLYLYAQSWAWVTFLMDKYPEGFLHYQNRMASRTAQGTEDIQWLLESIGRDLRGLENEFREYMAKFEKQEDPYIAQFVRIMDILRD